MKTQKMALWMIIILFFISIQSYAQYTKDAFEIYFINNKPDKSELRWGYKLYYKNYELNHIIATNTPYIKTKDIETYDWKKHSINLKDLPWRRLEKFIISKKRRNFEVLFVVAINKKPIYYGCVISILSTYVSYPWIDSWDFDDTNPVWEYEANKPKPARKFFINYVEPKKWMGIKKIYENDPRKNEELYELLKHEGKIEG